MGNVAMAGVLFYRRFSMSRYKSDIAKTIYRHRHSNNFRLERDYVEIIDEMFFLP